VVAARSEGAWPVSCSKCNYGVGPVREKSRTGPPSDCPSEGLDLLAPLCPVASPRARVGDDLPALDGTLKAAQIPRAAESLPDHRLGSGAGNDVLAARGTRQRAHAGVPAVAPCPALPAVERRRRDVRCGVVAQGPVGYPLGRGQAVLLCVLCGLRAGTGLGHNKPLSSGYVVGRILICICLGRAQSDTSRMIKTQWS
jgi:hypothetical protein